MRTLVVTVRGQRCPEEQPIPPDLRTDDFSIMCSSLWPHQADYYPFWSRALDRVLSPLAWKPEPFVGPSARGRYLAVSSRGFGGEQSISSKRSLSSLLVNMWLCCCTAPRQLGSHIPGVRLVWIRLCCIHCAAVLRWLVYREIFWCATSWWRRAIIAALSVVRQHVHAVAWCVPCSLTDVGVWVGQFWVGHVECDACSAWYEPL